MDKRSGEYTYTEKCEHDQEKHQGTKTSTQDENLQDITRDSKRLPKRTRQYESK